MKLSVTTQSLASVARQTLAILGITFGIVTQSVSGLKLPVAISTILTVGGALIIAIEHYVGDPSTGTLTKGTPSGPVPLAPVPPTQVPPTGSTGVAS